MFVKVIPFKTSFQDTGLYYDIGQLKLDLGDLVLIEIGKKNFLGIVVGFSNKKPDFKIKKISKKIFWEEKKIFDKKKVEFILFLIDRYFCLPHKILSLFLISSIEKKILQNPLEFNSSKIFKFSDFLGDENKEINSLEINLSKGQEKIFKQIMQDKEKKFLLFGVTGSGKTEIYIKIIIENLKQGKQTLLLIPEIILGNQIFERLKKVFGDNVFFINSSVSLKKREQYFFAILRNQAKIIIGTRSSLFYPFTNLSTIIVDEEHDYSYKSDQDPRYSTIELVDKISQIYNIKIILASGTPSINSMYKALNGEYKLLNLLEKFS